MIVVAHTGPVNYLALSGQIDLAHDLYRTFTPSTEKAAGEVG
ncbi:MAG TPA: hypothetical protein VN829_01960 [Dongiaceae bacterium]|nr:hypothetical protein [Dongiaceae bacterium]